MIRERILARLVWIIVSVWNKSITFRVLNKEALEQLAAKGQNCIYAFWHGSLLMLLQSCRDSRILIPVSESRDGEFMTWIAKYFGFEVARGSSKRKGHKALLSLVRGMREGKNVGITVDGPRGPLHQVKPGTVFLAGALNAPIIPVAVAAKRAWILEKSWDKLIIPVPFTEVLILCGEPLYVNSTSDEELASGQKRLEAELVRLTHAAGAHVARRAEMVAPQTMNSGPY
jgi:lysophospholipid acyltransferase (LPLAT)-like uncharacterized protein